MCRRERYAHARLRLSDHTHSRPVFDGPGGIVALELAQYRIRCLTWDALQADQRRLTDHVLDCWVVQEVAHVLFDFTLLLFLAQHVASQLSRAPDDDNGSTSLVRPQIAD